MDTCPPLEDIAAFLDDMLSPEERERITAHLASCEKCYEIFSGAVHFQEDEGAASETDGGDVVPFPFVGETDRMGVPGPAATVKEKVRPRASRWLALAASLLLVPALGYLAWRELMAPPRIVLADVAEPLELEASASDLYEGVDFRGQDPSARPVFMTGVYLLDLRQSLRAQDVERTRDLLQDLSRSLEEIPFLPAHLESLAKSYREEFPGMKVSSDLARFAPRHPANEAEIQKELSDEDAFQFGLWAEAGHLSARRQSPAFFEDRNNRRFLDHLLKQTPWVGDDFLDEVPTDLQAIQEIWDSDKLTEAEYTKLATLFESIIRAYDTSDEL